MRYRLDVVAHNIIDVVEHAGGWIFDRALAGWDVTVLVPDPADVRPLRVLGADVVDLETLSDARRRRRRPDAIAISATFCELDSRAHADILGALRRGDIDVTVWGESWMSPPEYRGDPVVHRLSLAARAFKTQALRAAAVPEAANGPVEVFRAGASAFPSMGGESELARRTPVAAPGRCAARLDR